MADLESVLTVAGAIGTSALTLAGALKLLANAITTALREGHESLDKARAAVEDNSAATRESTQVLRDVLAKAAGRIALLFLVLTPWLLTGCAGQDAMTIRAMERDRQIWEEDRDPKLDPELVKSRVNEFDAHLRYERSK